jgi:ATP-dependent protease HslVU (ClpYQ) peptidase subunit
MTCIVGITDGKRIVMGADSAASTTDNPEIYSFATEKIFTTGEYVVGVCGSYRAGQIVRWEMDWPEPPEPGVDIEGFMVREVVKAISQALVANRFKGATEGTRVPQFMIGLRGRLFTLTGDESVGSLKAPWMAIGSGRHSAYGALHVLAAFELELEDKVRRTLGAAQSQVANVREPFHLLSVG